MKDLEVILKRFDQPDEITNFPKGKFEKINVKIAGNKMAIKFPRAMASADIPSNLYFIKFTFIA